MYIDENKSNGFSSYIFLGCARGATGKLRARAPARAQTGLLYIEHLVCLWGHRVIKNVGERSDPVRDGNSVVLGKSRVLSNSHFTVHYLVSTPPKVRIMLGAGGHMCIGRAHEWGTAVRMCTRRGARMYLE